MSEENKAFARRWFENFAAGNFEEQQANCGPGHLFHFPLSPEPMDPEAHNGAQQGFKAAVPDLQFDILEQLADGDKVITRFALRGTHSGEFMGLPPTGNALEVRGINIMQIVDGKNAEEWDALDTLALMQQLGAVPTQEEG